MTDAELIARLHLPWPIDGNVEEVTLPVWVLELTGQSADRIEALTKEREQWRRAAETRAEGWKISDDARIEAEIKLAKAVWALGDIVKDCEADYPPSHGAIKHFARATLAEIKGESHE